ncbi:hypothetical protein CH063_05956, partial [Colletotrichum higginsianum]
TIDIFRYHTRSGAAGSESHSQRTNRFGLDPETWVTFSSEVSCSFLIWPWPLSISVSTHTHLSYCLDESSRSWGA